MLKKQFIFTGVAATALLLNTAVTGVQAQKIEPGKAAEANKVARVKVLMKEGEDYLMLDTTLVLAPGVSMEDAVKNLKADGTTLKSLGAKKVKPTELGSPSDIASVRVFSHRLSDSTKTKLFRVQTTDTLRAAVFRQLSTDSAFRVAKGQHIFLRATTADGADKLNGHPFTIASDALDHVLLSRGLGDSLKKASFVYSLRKEGRILTSDSSQKQSIRVERLDNDGDVKITRLRGTGEEILLENGEYEVTKFKNGGTQILILRTPKKAQNSESKDHGKKKNKKEDQTNLSVQVYPNPTSGTIQLSFSVDKKADTKVRIVDSKGQAVFEDEKSHFQGLYTREIHLARFGPGLYVIQLMVGKVVQSEKVLVQ